MEIRNNILLIIIHCISVVGLSAQTTIQKSYQLNWEEIQVLFSPLTGQTNKVWMFPEAVLKKDHPEIPVFSEQIRMPYYGKPVINISNEVYEDIELNDPLSSRAIGNQINIYTNVIRERNQYFAGINFIPIIKTGTNRYAKLVRFNLSISFVQGTRFHFKNPIFANESVLSTGQIYKLSVSKRGIYRIDYSFFQDSIQMNPTSIDPRRIQVYGQPAGALPEPIFEEKPDDLIEMAVWVQGQEDGSFDPGDYVLFYHPGLHKQDFDLTSESYIQQNHIYDDRAYVFVKLQQNTGKRIEDQSVLQPSDYSSEYFDEVQRVEYDRVNLLGDFGSAQGSGQRWFGQIFTNDREQNLSNLFDFRQMDINFPIRVRAEFAGRSRESSIISLRIDQNEFEKEIGAVNTGDVESLYARVVSFDEMVNVNVSDPQITIDYRENGTTSEGWLDFLQISCRRRAVFENGPLVLRDKESVNYSVSEFGMVVEDKRPLIWDISIPLSPLNQVYEISGNHAYFLYESETLKEFFVFNPDTDAYTPVFIGDVANQNLHGIGQAEVIIIYHPEFEEAAVRLSEHRRNFSGFEVLSVNVEHVFEEFSAGRQDPTAIRNFAKMIYDRSDQFNYLLLFGDGSYDYRNIISGLENQSFIPVYETRESLNPLSAFPTDDYFALLSDNEGDNLRGALDIAVGRLPAKTSQEADILVDKIIRYETDPAGFEDWRLRLAFLADDEDNNIHLNQADNIAEDVSEKHPVFNLEKIYFDAFPQTITPGGARYPAASERFNSSVFKGLLVANYLGHGGPTGWSQERVLRIDDITDWENPDKLPLIITATCSFTGFDDPSIVTGGEHAILSENGGAVALFSTVRSVYSSQNFRLTKSVFDTIFTKTDSKHLPIGEILKRAKNTNSADTININARKFLLIGDPSMPLAIPEYPIITSSVNANPVSSGKMDTIKALQTVSFSGYVSNPQNQPMEDFNGLVHVTVFDKPIQQKTLVNDGGSREKSFEVQKNILFKGSASVQNGEFDITFVVPVDINYTYGRGKISYYAVDSDNRDAAGYFDQFIIGGTDDGAAEDNEGPEVDVFMNNENFVSGGITNENPVLFVKLRDENGINQSGTSIGHDITAIIDGNTQNTIILNDFYTATIDDFKSGIVRFPLNDLAEGEHRITVKAFDVANNAGEGMIDFIVTDPDDRDLKHVLNYPNPFTSSTNFSFEHDLPNTSLDLALDIYTLSGKLVKSIRRIVFSDGYRVNDIHWDGTDDYGEYLAKGIYLYKIKINAEELNISKESAFEKLVILR